MIMCSYNHNRWSHVLGEADALRVNGEKVSEARLKLPCCKAAGPKEETRLIAEMEIQTDMHQRKLAMRPHHRNFV